MSTETEDQLIELVEWRNRHRFGKYRGTVESVEEGDRLGYISVKVHNVFDSELVIADVRPCTPFAGDKHGFVAIPEKGDGVWVEFEGGDTSLPIWSGFWWKDGQVPGPKDKLIRSFITSKGHKLLLDDKDNKVTLLHAGGAKIAMTDDDITIKIGQGSITIKSDTITLAAGPTSKIEIRSSEIELSASPVGTVKLTSGGVDLANGAMTLGV